MPPVLIAPGPLALKGSPQARPRLRASGAVTTSRLGARRHALQRNRPACQPCSESGPPALELPQGIGAAFHLPVRAQCDRDRVWAYEPPHERTSHITDPALRPGRAALVKSFGRRRRTKVSE